MANRHWNPRLEYTMKLVVPTLNHDIVMKVLGKAETAKHGYLFSNGMRKLDSNIVGLHNLPSLKSLDR